VKPRRNLFLVDTTTTPGIDETPQQLAQPAIAVEVVGGHGKCTQKGKNAIARLVNNGEG